MVNKKRQTPEQVAAISDALVPAAEQVPEPIGAPEEFGLPYSSATPEKTRVWDRQELFLAQFRECGKIGKAAKSVGLTRWAVDKWQSLDVYGFNGRMKAAHADYCETIEQMIDDRLENPQGNRGSDPLLMFKTKAEMPEKYREDVKVIDSGIGLKLLEKLTDAARASLPALEGEYTELPEGS